MKTLIITIQDTINGELVSSQVVERYQLQLNEEYLISLIRKVERDLEKLIWQRELQACDEKISSTSGKFLKSEKK